MKINMPYGMVEINTVEEAVHFIRNHCSDCERVYDDTCSGAYAKDCEQKVQFLIDNFKNK